MRRAATPTKVVGYRGYTLTVPSGWPVYRLSRSSTVCVRFNRHAVYLGTPGIAQNCPTNAMGRTEAILVQPRRGAHSIPLGGAPTHLVVRTEGVVVTATWRRSPAVIRRALGVRSLASPSTVRPRRSGRAHPPAPRIAEVVPRVVSHVLGPPAAPGAIYNGLGFDACSAPSTSAMAAWAASSPFGAVGIYIGGANIACSQPNLNATWVSEESQAGWHLIPIYVGLQAPSNSCGCAGIVAASATTEGTAAAADAVAQAQALGIGPGNPIYFDMEGYTRTATNTNSVLAFLGAWTAGLHAAGYKSGIYSNASSGITDLVSQVGTGYLEPDDVWFANWNGLATVSDPALPPLEWIYGQRLHQYRGGPRRCLRRRQDQHRHRLPRRSHGRCGGCGRGRRGTAGRRGRADHLRDAAGWRDPERRARELVGFARVLLLPMGAMQRLRRGLYGDSRRNRAALCAHRGRLWADTPRRRGRDERSRAG